MTDDLLPSPATDVVHRELNGQIVLVHLGGDRIYALNETGARLWELLVEGRGRSEISAQLLLEFDVEPDVLDAEIDRLLDELGRAGLIA
jgi:hypothetical protein